jgi:predicted metal-binding protein
MTASDATIFICVSCTVEGAPSEQPGRALFETVKAKLASSPERVAIVKAVDCLAVCKRPCTIALAGEGKWTYVVGDLGPDANADDVLAAAEAYGATANGIIPWRDRPQSFRKGVISRIPPLTFRPEEQGL